MRNVNPKIWHKSGGQYNLESAQSDELLIKPIDHALTAYGYTHMCFPPFIQRGTIFVTFLFVLPTVKTSLYTTSRMELFTMKAAVLLELFPFRIIPL